MTHWHSVKPTIVHFDGRVYQVPDAVAQNWMHSGSACSHIKYCFCVHSALFRADADHWQYDAFWHEWIDITQEGGMRP